MQRWRFPGNPRSEDQRDGRRQFKKEAEVALGLSSSVHSCALLPIDYPMGRFGPAVVFRWPISCMMMGGPDLSGSVATQSVVCHDPSVCLVSDPTRSKVCAGSDFAGLSKASGMAGQAVLDWLPYVAAAKLAEEVPSELDGFAENCPLALTQLSPNPSNRTRPAGVV